VIVQPAPAPLMEIAVETALLVLKIAFLVLLYLFIWRIVRAASRDLRLPQESFVLRPEGGVPRSGSGLHTGQLVVLKSPALDEGREIVLNSAPLTVGRGEQNDIELEEDDFASARHARFEPRQDGVWIADMGSTNGTYVNGIQLERPRKLSPGDIVRVGQTDLRFDP
jgi:pSer/pThr/pTyr-binding forkhead associated (FHA) protein